MLLNLFMLLNFLGTYSMIMLKFNTYSQSYHVYYFLNLSIKNVV